MNRADAIKLCRYVHAATPAQRLDEYTPQAWADVLEDLPCTFDEGRAAVVAIKRRQVFVDCSDIIAEVRETRAERISRTEIEPPPADLDGQAYVRELRSRIADAARPETGPRAIGGQR